MSFLSVLKGRLQISVKIVSRKSLRVGVNHWEERKKRQRDRPWEVSGLVDIATVVGVIFDELLKSHLAVSTDIGVVAISVEHDDGKGQKVSHF
jgi:hypothetical protein